MADSNTDLFMDADIWILSFYVSQNGFNYSF